jgi:hypothetical protein
METEPIEGGIHDPQSKKPRGSKPGGAPKQNGTQTAERSPKCQVKAS